MPVSEPNATANAPKKRAKVARVDHHRRSGQLVLVALTLLVSCAKKASREPGAGDPLAASRAELDETVAALRALGVGGEVAGAVGSSTSAPEVREANRPAKSKRIKQEPRRDDAAASKPVTPESPPVPTGDAVTTDDPSAKKAADEEAPNLATDFDDAGARCRRICELAGVACRLEQRICRLAEQHAGEREYDDACFYARDQCELASDACDDCGGSCRAASP
ncbi:MAG: hypothetical protein IPH07_09030 [Deltaproteobacteria bacterium]|nr:hypothetical protein [Deltaproteobacteria bacterium]